MQNLLQPAGGRTDQYQISAIFFIAVFLFNLVDQIHKGQPVLERMQYTVPFLVVSILYLTKYKGAFDLMVDCALSLILVITSRIGEFSGVPFIYLLIFRARKPIHYILILFITTAAALAGSILNGQSTAGVFVILSLYAYMGGKYYYNIYKPVQALKQRIKKLEDKLSHYGPSGELSASEIKIRYPFMNDRRIKDLRALAAGSTAKDLQYDNGVSYSYQSKDLRKMMHKFEKITGEEIKTATHLVVVAVKCGIVPVNFITAGTDADSW